MKKLYMFIMVMVLTVLICAMAAYGNPTTSTINTAANTEFNTATPTLNATCAGNYSKFNAYLWEMKNATAYTLVSTKTRQVSNNTAFTLVSNTSLSGGYDYYFKVSCYNGTSMKNSTVKRMLINYRPTVSATDTDGSLYMTLGKTVTVIGTVTDKNLNYSTNDKRNIAVCKTDSFSSNTCAGGNWCTNTSNSTVTAINCTFSIVSSMTAGTKNYYVYAWDDNQYASAASSSGNFKVAGRGDLGGGVFSQPPTQNAVTSSISTNNIINYPILGIAAWFWALLGILLFIITRKKRR